jgi:hypothetical protein
MARILGTLLLAPLLALLPLGAAAQPTVAPEVAREVRAVIEAQLDAFRRDDASHAFSLATPNIRETFGDAETFMAMVKSSYAVVYRPKSVVFEAPVVIDDELVQPVHLTDAEGRAWLALYPMERQPDGSWRTNGCKLVRIAGIEA